MARPQDERLEICRRCGCNGDGSCNRVIDHRNGSVMPLRDTGFRMGMKPAVVRQYHADAKRN